MPNVVIKRGSDVFEVTDLTLDQVRDLLGMNGHQRAATGETISRTKAAVVDSDSAIGDSPDYRTFYGSLSDKAKKFFEILRQHPNGIESQPLAAQLGFRSGNQVGGVAGGGVAKLAKKFGIKMKHLYSSEVTFENGVRARTYKPGKDIGELK